MLPPAETSSVRAALTSCLYPIRSPAMAKMKIGTGDWIVVCDGRKALILDNLGDRMFPNLHTKEVREQSDLPTQAQGSTAPGRVYQSIGEARSAIEQTDWHDESERSFLKA